jgi:hypothetical protein
LIVPIFNFVGYNPEDFCANIGTHAAAALAELPDWPAPRVLVLAADADPVRAAFRPLPPPAAAAPD